MKQEYFSDASIQRKAAEMLGRVQALRRQRAVSLTPASSALLVLDMQDYFLNSSSRAFVPSAPAIIPGIRELIRAYSMRRRPVFFTRHLNAEQDAGMMAKWWRELIVDTHPLSAVTGDLALSRGTVINKSQYDAFYQTDLEDHLRKSEVKQVLICGVMTHLCCETTARSAFVRGFEVFFTIDGTATYNEDFHMATLLNLSHGVAVPVLVNEALKVVQTQNES
jgi:isochorismate hydrolase